MMAVVERLCEPDLFLELVETSRWRVENTSLAPERSNPESF